MTHVMTPLEYLEHIDANFLCYIESPNLMQEYADYVTKSLVSDLFNSNFTLDRLEKKLEQLTEDATKVTACTNCPFSFSDKQDDEPLVWRCERIDNDIESDIIDVNTRKIPENCPMKGKTETFVWE